MAHCPYDQLGDLIKELNAIRKLPKIKEPKPGIFYVGSQGFLHFHIKDGRRWADVKLKGTWGPPIDLPFDSSAADRRRFLDEVRRRYQIFLGRD